MELFVATGGGLAHLDRQDDTWRSTLSMQGSGIQCLALDPHHSGVLYAGSRGQGVYKTRGDRHWEKLDFPQKDVFSVAVSPADGAVYAGCEPSMLYVSRDEGRTWMELKALRSIPSAPTWSFPPRPWTSHVRWIAPNPHDPKLLLAGIELGGLMRSEDGGKTWEDHRPGAQKDVHSLAWHPKTRGRAYEAGGGGAAWSHDGGKTWKPADAGRDRHYTYGLAVHPENPDLWFVSACPGAGHAHRSDNAEAYLYRWRKDRWEALEGSLPQPLKSFPYALCYVGRELFAGLGDGRIYTSRDDGNRWELLEVEGKPPERVSALVGVTGQ